MSKEARKFVRFVLADQAFRQVAAHGRHTIALNLREDDLIFTPNLAGIVVTYAKNFVSGSGMGPLPDHFSKFSDPSLAHTHMRIMEARHKLYAHRDAMAAPNLSYDDNATGAPYEIAIEFHGAPNGFTCYPLTPELNPEILPGIVALCEFQTHRIQAELKTLIPVMTHGRSYKRGVRYRVGVDFP